MSPRKYNTAEEAHEAKLQKMREWRAAHPNYSREWRLKRKQQLEEQKLQLEQQQKEIETQIEEPQEPPTIKKKLRKPKAIKPQLEAENPQNEEKME